MIKAEVVKACVLNGKPKNPGDSVEVDETTFNNLVRKGVLKAAGAKAVKIVDVPSLAAQPAKTEPDGGFRVHAPKTKRNAGNSK